VLRGTTSRGLCGLVWPSRTSERGGEGYCVKGGGGEEGERERERAREPERVVRSVLLRRQSSGIEVRYFEEEAATSTASAIHERKDLVKPDF
jgi:hypothetical protein